MKKCSNCGCVDLTETEGLQLAQIQLQTPTSGKELARRFKITPEAAEMRLLRWMRRGFLVRERITIKGDEKRWIYFNAKDRPPLREA